MQSHVSEIQEEILESGGIIRVLHFDDEIDFLNLTRDYVEAIAANDIVIESQTDPSRIMDFLTMKRYDVIVSDFMMPGMDGLELLRELNSQNNPVPFIMFTGRGREEVVIKSLNLGAEYYIEKSNDPDSHYGELVHAIRSVVKHRRTEIKLKESQQRFRYLTDQSILGILILQDDSIKYVNQAAINMIGYTKEEIKSWEPGEYLKIFHPDDVDFIREQSRKIQMGGVSDVADHYNYRIITKSGINKWIDNYSKTILFNDKSADLITIIDISTSKESEEALRSSQARYKSLFEMSPISLWEEDFSEIKKIINELKKKGVKDFNNYFDEHPDDLKKCGEMIKIIDVNQATVDMYDAKSKEELLGSLDKILTSESYSVLKDEIACFAENQTWYEREIVNRTLSGRDITISLKLSVHPGYEDTLSKVLVSCVDITETKKIEENLRKSLESHRLLVQTMNEGLLILNESNKITYINDMMSEILGYSKEEITGKIITDFLYEESSKPAMISNIEHLKQGDSENYEISLSHKEGSRIEAYISPQPIFEDDRFTGCFAVVSDFTERKNAENALKESEERYRSLITTMSEGIWITDTEERTIFTNPALEKMLGYSSEELLGTPVEPFIEEKSLEIYNNRLTEISVYAEKLKVLKENGITSSTYELDFVRKNGSILHCRVAGTAIFKNGKVSEAFGVLTDVTLQKEAEEKLRSSQRMLQLVMNNIPQYIFWKDKNSIYLGCNENFARASGLKDPQDIIGKTDNELPWTEDEIKAFREIDKRIMITDTPELGLVEKIHHQPLGKEILVSTNKIPLHDVSGEVIGILGAYEDITEKIEAEKQLRIKDNAINSSINAIAIADLKGNVIYVNQSFLNMWGYDSDEEVLGKITATDCWKDKQDTIAIIKSIVNTKRESWQGEAIGIRKDGSEFNTSVSTSLVKDDTGKSISMMASVVDITDRKIAEEKLRLQREELRDFVQFMAHDLGNSLSTIVGFGKLSIKKDDISLVERIISQTEFMKRLLDRSLTLANAGLAIEKTSIIDINNLISRVAHLIVPTEIEFINDGNLPILHGDQAKLSQVFKNLFENAIIHGKPSYIEIRYLEQNNHYEVQVINDGKLIPPELIASVFKRGYSTTKSAGLGLTIVKKIVEAHGWKIDLQSSENTTIFRFIIPKRII